MESNFMVYTSSFFLGLKLVNHAESMLLVFGLVKKGQPKVKITGFCLMNRLPDNAALKAAAGFVNGTEKIEKQKFTRIDICVSRKTAPVSAEINKFSGQVPDRNEG